MQLDFTAIDNLGNGNQQTHPYNSLEAPRVKEKQLSKQSYQKQNKSLTNANNDDMSNIFDTFKIQKEEIKREKAYITKINSMLDNASRGKSEILKAIKAGNPASEILVIALETLSDISQDQTFKSQAIDYLMSIQGEGLGDKSLIDKAINETVDRYNKLKTSYEQATDPKTKARLLEAIKAHQKRMIELNNKSLEARK